MLKILLVEDDPDQIYLYKTRLQMEKFKIVEAHNGKQGIEIAKQEMPDFILLDLVMEDMSGMKVLEALKKDKKTKKIPIVLLTNLIKKALIDQATKLGAVGFWPKTEVLPEEIVCRIKKIIKKPGGIKPTRCVAPSQKKRLTAARK